MSSWEKLFYVTIVLGVIIAAIAFISLAIWLILQGKIILPAAIIVAIIIWLAKTFEKG